MVWMAQIACAKLKALELGKICREEIIKAAIVPHVSRNILTLLNIPVKDCQ